MKRKLFKGFAMLLSCVIILSVFAACGGKNNELDSKNNSQEVSTSGEKDQKPVTITFSTQPFASPQNVPKVQEYIDKFHKENPNIKVDVTVATTDDQYRIKLLQDVAAGNAADVAFCDGSWLPQFNQMDALVPLDKWFTPEKQSKYFDFAINGSKFDGKVKALWFHTGLWVLYYRTDLLKEAGYDNPPKDWNELLEMGKKLTVDNDNDGITDVYALGVPGARDVVTSCTLLPWFWGHDGAELTRDGKVAFGKGKDKEAMVDTLNFLRKLVEEKIVSEDTASLKFTDVESNFLGGTNAMAMLGSWHYASLKKNGGEEFIKNVEIAPLPAVPGNEPVTTAGGWTIAMFTEDKEKQDAAWKWMEYFAGKDIQKALTIDASQMTTLKEVYDEPELKNDKVMQTFKEALFGGKTRDGVPFYSAIDDKWQELVQIALLKEGNIEEAVENAAKEVEEVAASMK